MSPAQKVSPHHIPYYFAACNHKVATPSRSHSKELATQQEADLHAEDLKPAELQKLKQELELNNLTGRMVTFDRVLKSWVTWYRYVFNLFVPFPW
jgi:hypothetical protein